MYLSRIQLTDAIVKDSQLGKLLQRNSYGMHSLLWDLFDRKERFLFREEDSAEQMGIRHHRPLYYVLSASAPSTQSPLFYVETKSFSPLLQAGETLGFKLRANPTVSRRQPGVKNSQRHDVVMDAQYHWLRDACNKRHLHISGSKGNFKSALLSHPDFNGQDGNKHLDSRLNQAISEASRQWLVARAEKNGFELKSVQTTAYRWNALPEKGRNAGFSSLDYEGVLTVGDLSRFVECLYQGLGKSRAFGCGLVLIRRLHP